MDQVEKLIHLLNDDNLDLLEHCKMCRACVGIPSSPPEFRCGFHDHDLIKNVSFCKEREDLKRKLHN